MKIAFLDRDGTINLDYPDQMWANVKEPEFLEGSFEGLKFILSQRLSDYHHYKSIHYPRWNYYREAVS